MTLKYFFIGLKINKLEIRNFIPCFYKKIIIPYKIYQKDKIIF